jgi:hypothetical protein
MSVLTLVATFRLAIFLRVERAHQAVYFVFFFSYVLWEFPLFELVSVVLSLLISATSTYVSS